MFIKKRDYRIMKSSIEAYHERCAKLEFENKRLRENHIATSYHGCVLDFTYADIQDDALKSFEECVSHLRPKIMAKVIIADMLKTK